MKKNAVPEFEMEKQDLKIRLKRAISGGVPTPSYEEAPPGTYLPVPTNIQPAVPVPSLPTAANSELEIKSPMIGTFYRAPSPESGPYVEVGTEVNPETVVCIIEAMKVMNEVKAEAKGTITQVMVENAKPVAFAQHLFKRRSD